MTIRSKGNKQSGTNIAGVFHAGEVQDRTYCQAITAISVGCAAAIVAERFLEAERIKQPPARPGESLAMALY
jgi:thioredoxin reductase (NADPH)